MMPDCSSILVDESGKVHLCGDCAGCLRKERDDLQAKLAQAREAINGVIVSSLVHALNGVATAIVPIVEWGGLIKALAALEAGKEPEK